MGTINQGLILKILYKNIGLVNKLILRYVHPRNVSQYNEFVLIKLLVFHPPLKGVTRHKKL